eukprot:m.10303 g.10303  ORF g.10303 m.10303 type:complete len:217 (+) comp3649_c0_seq1:73-723(+)
MSSLRACVVGLRRCLLFPLSSSLSSTCSKATVVVGNTVARSYVSLVSSSSSSSSVALFHTLRGQRSAYSSLPLVFSTCRRAFSSTTSRTSSSVLALPLMSQHGCVLSSAPFATLVSPVFRAGCRRHDVLFEQVRGLKTKKRQIKRKYRHKSTYKMKTNKSASSRFKVLKSGGIKYWRRGRVHNSQAKSQKQHRQLRRAKVIKTGTLFKKLRRAIQQ